MTTSIKFYWNGIKLNGEKALTRCFYSLDNNAEHLPAVSISCRDYSGRLPGDLFVVTNDTDSMTDYFDTDRAVLTPDHPLYKFARYAAECAEIRHLEYSINQLAENIETRPAFYARDDFYKNDLAEKRAKLAHLQAHKNPGHPTASDLAAVQQLNAAAETARLAAEHAAELARREEIFRQRSEGRIFIETTAEQYPICDDAPVVTIHWSEHPAFYSWKDDELKLSVAAAEIILAHFDNKKAKEKGGYFKTSFVIDYTDPETDEPHTYEGRYDLGDLDGGLIEHIRNFGRNYKSYGQNTTGMTDTETGAEIVAFADWLESYAAGGRIISVTVSPWLEKAAGMHQAKAQKLREAAEQQEQQSIQDLFDSIKMLTNEQLKSAVMLCSPTGEYADVARFFLQELYSRNPQEALETFRQWQAAA